MTKKISLIAIMMAIYIVLSSFVKCSLGVGNIQLELGYVALTIACVYGGVLGGVVVGGFGALVSSTFFSAYGISPSWITANVIIALVVGATWSLAKKTKKRWFKMLLLSSSIILGCALGLILSKTLIECYLYDIPFEIKVVKNSVAFVADCSCMLIALPIIARISKTKGNE